MENTKKCAGIKPGVTLSRISSCELGEVTEPEVRQNARNVACSPKYWEKLTKRKRERERKHLRICRVIGYESKMKDDSHQCGQIQKYTWSSRGNKLTKLLSLSVTHWETTRIISEPTKTIVFSQPKKTKKQVMQEGMFPSADVFLKKHDQESSARLWWSAAVMPTG